MRSGTVVRSLKVGLMLAALCGGATAATPADDVAAGLQWRLLGPFRGGWSTAVQGIPDRPDTF